MNTSTSKKSKAGPNIPIWIFWSNCYINSQLNIAVRRIIIYLAHNEWIQSMISICVISCVTDDFTTHRTIEIEYLSLRRPKATSPETTFPCRDCIYCGLWLITLTHKISGFWRHPWPGFGERGYHRFNFSYQGSICSPNSKNPGVDWR